MLYWDHGTEDGSWNYSWKGLKNTMISLLSVVTSSFTGITEGQKRGQSVFRECCFWVMVQREGHATTPGNAWKPLMITFPVSSHHLSKYFQSLKSRVPGSVSLGSMYRGRVKLSERSGNA